MHPVLKKITRIGLPALFMAGVCQAETFPDYGISTMDIRGVLPNPVMEVTTTNGQDYNQVANKELTFKIEAKARCQNLHHVVHGQLLIYPVGAGTISDNYANDIIIGKEDFNRKTWASNWTPRSFKFPPNITLKNHAIQVCNAELGKRMVQGGTKADILKAGFETSIKKTTNQINFTCGGPSPLSRHPRSVENAHPITVKCDAYTPKPTVIPAVAATPLPSFKLQGAGISMAQTNYQGVCPAELAVKANIASNNLGGSFEYRFLEDGKASSGWQQKAVAKGQVNTLLAHTISIKEPQAETPNAPKGFQGNVQNQNQANAQAIAQIQQVPTHQVSIEVRRDNQQLTDSKEYQATCKTVNIGVAVFNPKPAPRPPVHISDLSPGKTITIGNTTGAWGSLIVVDASKMNDQKRGDACMLRMAYDVNNIGQGEAGSFTSRLFENNTALHTSAALALKAGDSKKISGHVFLNDGNHVLGVWVDHQGVVAESNETNNKDRVQVQVQGCTEKPQPIPARGSPRPEPQ